MNIDVYDTHVRTVEGDLLHFDVLIPSGDGNKATEYARKWLQSIGRTPHGISQENCCFCHSETATPEIQQYISEHGSFIIQMEGCPFPTGL